MVTCVKKLIPFVIIAGTAVAADLPNFTGTWKLSVTKSQFGKDYRTPLRQINTIEHNDPQLTVTQDEEYANIPRELHGTVKYTTDGKECVNEVVGYTFHATAKWDGRELVIDSTSDDDTPIHLVDRWSLAPDGKVLTAKRHFEMGKRSADQVLLFNKLE